MVEYQSELDINKKRKTEFLERVKKFQDDFELDHTYPPEKNTFAS